MLKRIVVLNGHKPEHWPALFREISSSKGIESEIVESKDCVISIGFTPEISIIHKNTTLPCKDTGYVIKRTGKDIYRTYLIAKALEDKVPLFSDEANLLSDKTASKMTLMVSLPKAGIKVPKSFLVDQNSYQQNKAFIQQHVTFPCVVKKPGSRGKQVWKIENSIELEKKINSDESLTLVQEYIENSYDIRVFIFDGQVVAAVKRNSADGFYNNLSKGGQGEASEITEEEKVICVRAAQIANLRVAGVDFVRTNDGILIFEVNKSPQMSIFSSFAKFDLEKTLSELMIESLSKTPKRPQD